MYVKVTELCKESKRYAPIINVCDVKDEIKFLFTSVNICLPIWLAVKHLQSFAMSIDSTFCQTFENQQTLYRFCQTSVNICKLVNSP